MDEIINDTIEILERLLDDMETDDSDTFYLDKDLAEQLHEELENIQNGGSGK